jgi:hypothetical protein
MRATFTLINFNSCRSCIIAVRITYKKTCYWLLRSTQGIEAIKHSKHFFSSLIWFSFPLSQYKYANWENSTKFETAIIQLYAQLCTRLWDMRKYGFVQW